MDEATLLRYRPLWTEEKVQHGATELSSLTPAEGAVYAALKSNSWGQGVRLEQERVEWAHAWSVLLAASHAMC